MDSTLLPVMRQKLRPGEQVLWTGQPRQGFFLRSTDSFLMPLGLGWGALAVFLAISLFQSPAPFQFGDLIVYTIDIMFAIIGIYLAVGRFFYDRMRRRHTWYAVTSSRAMIIQDWPFERVNSIELDHLTDMHLDEGFDDVGTIRFPGGDETVFYLMGGNESWPWAAGVAPPSFERIHDARRVYDLIRAKGIKKINE